MLYKVSFLKVNKSTRCDCSTFCVCFVCLCKFKRIPTVARRFATWKIHHRRFATWKIRHTSVITALLTRILGVSSV